MYTIQLQNGNEGKLICLRDAILARVQKDGRFRIGSVHMGVSGRGKLPTLYFQRIRLVNRKPYCGNHPGECFVNPYLGPQKKPNATYLEWDDWVAFHNLINGLLNQRHVSADVWTLPQDVSGKFWIRKGLIARRKYDYQDDWSRGGFQPIRVWNTGTPDQFAA